MPIPESNDDAVALSESKLSESKVPGIAESAVESADAIAYGKFSGASLATTGFDWKTAISCADSSHLAYEEPDRVKSVCEGQWNLNSCQFVQSGSTQCFVAATDAAVLVAFRGTKGALDWFSNLNLLERRTTFGSVHDGFYRAFQAVRTSLESLIEPLAQTRQVILTGHSLGGALATIAAATWNQRFAIRSIYTFGQPRVGFRSFQQFAVANFDNRFFRFVNADDIVPRVPPGYVHIGQLTHFDSQGNISNSNLESIVSSDQSSLSLPGFEAAKERLQAEQVHGLESAELEGLLPNYFADHRMAGYLAKIVNNTPS